MDNVISLKVVQSAELSTRKASVDELADCLEDLEIAISALSRLQRNFTDNIVIDYAKILKEAAVDTSSYFGIPTPHDFGDYICRLKTIRDILFGGLVNWDLVQAELTKQTLIFEEISK